MHRYYKEVHYFRFFRLTTGKVAMRYKYWSTSEVERPMESHEGEPSRDYVVDQFNEEDFLSQREDTTVATPEQEAGRYVTVLHSPVTGAPKWLVEDVDPEDMKVVQDSIRTVLSLESSCATEEERRSWDAFFAVAGMPAE